MGDYVCTIVSKEYEHYMQRFLYSVREAGWRGKIRVISTDKLYCNEEVVLAKQKFKTEVFNDSRWLKLELDRFFCNGDKVIFLDCDIVLFDGFPFDALLDAPLSMTTVPLHHDVTIEMPIIEDRFDVKPDAKYLASPLGFWGSDEEHEFFRVWRHYRSVAKFHDKGTMFALNMACYALRFENEFDLHFDPYLLPNDRCAYTLTVKFDEPDAIHDPVLMHYGGKLGKRIWHEEYAEGIKYGYR